MAQQEGPPTEVETKPTKAIVGFLGTLATGLLATMPDGWTGLELAGAALGAVIVGLGVYGFKNEPKD